MNCQITVPPPSTKMLLIFCFDNCLKRFLSRMVFVPVEMILIGNLSSFAKFFLGMFFETAIMVGT